MAKFLGWIAGGTAVIALALAIGLAFTWAVWLLWCWVLPQAWPSGPASVIAPSFWVFAAVWFILGLVGRMFSGLRS